jgi:hypothetical protein
VVQVGADDTAYIINHLLCPPSGTEAVLFFRAPTAAEQDEIAKVEKNLK